MWESTSWPELAHAAERNLLDVAEQIFEQSMEGQEWEQAYAMAGFILEGWVDPFLKMALFSF